MVSDVLSGFVDLDRYPLTDPAAFAPQLADCRQQLQSSSFVRLPGFLRPDVAARMANEILAVLPRAYRREKTFSAYAEDPPSDSRLPEAHVRRRRHLNRQYVVTADVLPATGMVAALYNDDVLTATIAKILNEPALYRLADPIMSYTGTVMADGDTHGWHFDLNDFVVSILLQAPDAGGTFDFAPNIRSDRDENYAEVAAVMDAKSTAARSVAVEAGTLLVFCGRRALHRVPPVIGPTPRVIALFSYDRAPGVTYSSDVYMRVVGRSGPARP
jgi:hypothetical protein